ncbi:hypothetical protein NEOLEDRAFT_1159120 [Neolentinus lepideus HHB14362 ss-1]|uniref:DNA breaking-rejoining enzyme n=1 Tax=Neolentinus lepideus HHB14362 ss-1 TaxID=1314782 RepID=A0A165NAZ4_9AGAM|nr:hypothetical protein NEOLEDRAFT_1159120 [Neolentinus lepideus HHB14362 ss-1]
MITVSPKSRQPLRKAWTRERLLYERSLALSFALDTSSKASYSSALNSYLTFCSLHTFPVEPTEETFSFYITFMSAHIEPRSVDSYLSGICSELEVYYPNVRQVRQSHLVARTLRGCKRRFSKPISRAQPISKTDIETVHKDLSRSDLHDDILFLSLLLTGFYALMRLGELIWPDNNDLCQYRKVSTRDTVHHNHSGYDFVLAAHKADAFYEGATYLATKGVSPELIRRTGRWSSSAWEAYVREHPVLLQSIVFSGHSTNSPA